MFFRKFFEGKSDKCDVSSVLTEEDLVDFSRGIQDAISNIEAKDYSVMNPVLNDTDCSEPLQGELYSD